MNLNKIAVEISKIEGLREQVNIAQIKEVLKCAFIVLAQEDGYEVLKVINRYKNR
jgi:hypothetical protein